jgi:hypothetical protein
VSTVYTTRLLGGACASGGELIYEVPEGKRAVLIDVSIQMPQDPEGIYRPIVGFDLVTSCQFINYLDGYGQLLRTYHWQGRMAFDYGGGFEFSSGAFAEWPHVVVATGFLLTLP